MKITFITGLVIILLLILIKWNSNNLNFMTGKIITETFNNVPKNFLCKKNELACILSYQNYNQSCKDSFGIWNKFQKLNHNKKIKGKTLKILAIDSTKNPTLNISGKIDGPSVSLVGRYNITNYDGRMNLNNLQDFLNKNI
tara:strand:+ start:544 stop:966 length:423 start_codon:yes stop_codon:yes gene_type:complete